MGGGPTGWVCGRAASIKKRRLACVEARLCSRSPRRHPGYSTALAIGPYARHGAPDLAGRVGSGGVSRTSSKGSSSAGTEAGGSTRVRGRDALSTAAATDTAFPPLRKLAPFRNPLQTAARRGPNAPLDDDERAAAMADVVQDVYAPSSIGPMEGDEHDNDILGLLEFGTDTLHSRSGVRLGCGVEMAEVSQH